MLFIATCLVAGGPDAGKFKHYSTVHIDWRWEMLSIALDVLIPLIGILVAKLSLEKSYDQEVAKLIQ